MTLQELFELLAHVAEVTPLFGFGKLRGAREMEEINFCNLSSSIQLSKYSIAFVRSDPLDRKVELKDYESKPTIHGFADILMPCVYSNDFLNETIISIRSKDTLPGLKSPEELFKVIKNRAYDRSKHPLCYKSTGEVCARRRYTTGAIDLARLGIRMATSPGLDRTVVPCEQISHP